MNRKMLVSSDTAAAWLPVCAILAVAACEPGSGTGRAADLPAATAVEVPAAAGSAQPFVARTADGFILSWTEPADSGHALRFARMHTDGGWQPVGTVASGRHWFVNWADFPSVMALDRGELIAHWLQRSGPGTYAYDVMLSHSTDGGASWSEPVRPHNDGTETEHGFVSMFAHAAGAGVVWLDGRQFAAADGSEPTNDMAVRFATYAGGRAGAETTLDGRACDCCQTAAVVTSRGPLVAYRDRSADEIRDIAITRLIDGAWTEPAMLHDDRWHITGCPVNGPQAAAAGEKVVIAWFTQAQDTPRVQLAYSRDAGATFGGPVRVDDGAPLGRVDVLLLDDASALVVWLERAGEEAELRARLVTPAGVAGASRSIASTSAQRSSGFPRMAAHGNTVLIAWTEPGRPSRIRAARLDLDD
jgi:hypothetical protein